MRQFPIHARGVLVGWEFQSQSEEEAELLRIMHNGSHVLTTDEDNKSATWRLCPDLPSAMFR